MSIFDKVHNFNFFFVFVIFIVLVVIIIVSGVIRGGFDIWVT